MCCELCVVCCVLCVVCCVLCCISIVLGIVKSVLCTVFVLSMLRDAGCSKCDMCCVSNTLLFVCQGVGHVVFVCAYAKCCVQCCFV